MFAPKLDRRIELQHETLAASNSKGERVPSFTTYATVWAQKLEGGGREAFIAQTTYASTDVRFRIRHRTDVLPTDRVVYSGRGFDVLSVVEIGRGEGLEIFARAAA